MQKKCSHVTAIIWYNDTLRNLDIRYWLGRSLECRLYLCLKVKNTGVALGTLFIHETYQ